MIPQIVSIDKAAFDGVSILLPVRPLPPEVGALSECPKRALGRICRIAVQSLAHVEGQLLDLERLLQELHVRI